MYIYIYICVYRVFGSFHFKLTPFKLELGANLIAAAVDMPINKMQLTVRS